MSIDIKASFELIVNSSLVKNYDEGDHYPAEVNKYVNIYLNKRNDGKILKAEIVALPEFITFDFLRSSKAVNLLLKENNRRGATLEELVSVYPHLNLPFKWYRIHATGITFKSHDVGSWIDRVESFGIEVNNLEGYKHTKSISIDNCAEYKRTNYGDNEHGENLFLVIVEG